MFDDEDRILAAAMGDLGAIGGGIGGSRGGGRRGATFAARLLRKNVHEIELTLAMPLEAAADHVATVLAGAGQLLGAADTGPARARAVRAVVGGGFGNMNPVVITVSLTDQGPRRTAATVRGAAKEGLIKQRAGEKTAKLVADRLAPRETA
ncbi:hypothetical protein GCM10009665_13830 [Kitasatospora nipponensis]|uniref:Uncharacterized protein n=1 Tax=Kitasatospora nipponensis TaxID=258049 RepID=A0ABN1VYQ4_9ACTN